MSSHGIQIPGKFNAGGQYSMPYCPGRDFVNVYPNILLCIAKFFDAKKWPELVTIVANSLGVSEDEAADKICDANQVYVEVIRTCGKDPSENYAAVLERAGWNKLPHAVRYGYMALLGTVAAGQLFAGLRDVTLAGEVPPSHIAGICENYWEQVRAAEEGPVSE